MNVPIEHLWGLAQDMFYEQMISLQLLCNSSALPYKKNGDAVRQETNSKSALHRYPIQPYQDYCPRKKFLKKDI